MPTKIISIAGDLGELTPQNLPANLLARLDTLIVAGQHALHKQADYVCVNNAEQLDKLMKERAEKTTIIAPRDQYAKYVFYNKIECVPVFEDLKTYNFDPIECSQQILALATACWIGSPIIALFDFMLEPKKETPAIKAMLKIYPNTGFLFVRLKKGNKITVFDDAVNLKQMDEKEFLDFHNQYIKKK
jgi:lipopolysaccharide biosynthesis glycosyltransferase